MALFGYTLLVISKILVLILGTNISLLAYLSYKKHNQQLMLEVCIGIALITIGSIIEGIMYEFFAIRLVIDHIVESTFILVGMLIIAKSMFGGERND